MSRAIGAHLEGELRERYEAAEEAAPEENKSAFLRSVVADGLRAKEGDVLNAIGASDELRDAVEARREEGEPLDDTVRRLLRAADEKESAPGGAVFPSVAASMLAAGVALLFAGETIAGGWLTAGGGFAAVNYLLARTFGWGVWLREAVAEVRDGFRGVGGVRGFASLVVEHWRRQRPIDEPTTPVERAANAEYYIPALFAVFFILAGGVWVIVEAGLLPVLGPPGALLLVGLLLAFAYAIPGAMLVSSLAMLALASSASDRAAGASDPDPEVE